MDKVFIFGHKNPDTDAITSAIALSYLKQQLGMNTMPACLGEINKETRYVLDYFKIEDPIYLDDVKLQIKDVNYHKDCFVNRTTSIKDTYQYMEEKGITGVPVVDIENNFLGLITLKMIARNMMHKNANTLKTSYSNIIKVLDGEEILKFNDEIEGNILAAAYRSTTFMANIELSNEDILIVGDRHSIIEKAVESGVKLLIISGNCEIHDDHVEIARKNSVNIIRTKLDTFSISKVIELSNYIEKLVSDERPHTFSEEDYFNDFLSLSAKLNYNNYPIVDKNGKCKGLIRLTDITKKNRKQVILVDHNEFEQSVTGLDEAEILEIVDHHKIGNISTNNPINFRNMSVGSTNTIVYQLYLENKITIPVNIAGVMLSGILSDTLCLTSPTTTDLDRITVKALAEITGLDYEKYSMDMFKAGTSLEGKTKEEIINTDIKAFKAESKTFAVSQVFTLDYESIFNEKDEYLKMIEEIKTSKEYDFVLLAITDIIKNGSYIFYTDGIKENLEAAFNIDDFEQGTYIDGCVSRKKQIVPVLMDFIK